MVENLRTINRDLFVRRCVACGYDGALLKGGRADRCVRCGCDLALRPARSYAEMEGLVAPRVPPPSTPTTPRREPPMLQRWLVFIILAMMGLLSMIYLVAAAVP